MDQEVVVETFLLESRYSWFGFPILCPGEQPRFKVPAFFPKHVADCQLNEQLDTFFKVWGSEQLYLIISTLINLYK